MDNNRHDFSASQESLPDFKEYSPEFQKMVKEQGLKKLLRECHFEGSLGAWREQRETIVRLIKKKWKNFGFWMRKRLLTRVFERME